MLLVRRTPCIRKLCSPLVRDGPRQGALLEGRGRRLADNGKNISRWLSTSNAGTALNNATGTAASTLLHRPPLALRAALVGTSVGVCTPMFATAGVAMMWYRYLPQTLEGVILKWVLGILVGGGGGALMYNYVVPFLCNHSEIILPFALANGTAASFWYCVGEATVGLETMMNVQTVQHVSKAAAVTEATGAAGTAAVARVAATFAPALLQSLPLAGCALGLATSVTTAVLWEPMINLCWGEEVRTLLLGNAGTDANAGSTYNGHWMKDLYQSMLLFVGMPVGAIAGGTMHFLLKPLVVGTPGVPWRSRSLPVLGGLLAAAGTYFIVFRTSESEWWWEKRLDSKTGAIHSRNILSGAIASDKGKKADEAVLKRNVIEAFHDLNAFRLQIIAVFTPNIALPTGGSEDESTDSGSGSGSAAKAAGSKSGDNNSRFPFEPRSIAGEKITLRTAIERTTLLFLIDRLVRLKHLDLLLQKSRAEEDALLRASALVFEAPNSTEEDERKAIRKIGEQREKTAKLIGERRWMLEHAKNREGLDSLPEILKASEIGIWATSSSSAATKDNSSTLNPTKGSGSGQPERAASVLKDVYQAFDSLTPEAPAINAYTLLAVLRGEAASGSKADEESKKKRKLLEDNERLAYALALLRLNLNVLESEFKEHLQYEVMINPNGSGGSGGGLSEKDIQSFQRSAVINRSLSPGVVAVVVAAVAGIASFYFRRE